MDEKMLKPLEEFYCDTCGELIESPEEGYVVWKNNDELKDHGFIIIHQGKCDPGRRGSASRDRYPCSLPLTDFLGVKGLVLLTSFLSLGKVKANLKQDNVIKVADVDQFIDFFRRVQVPYYEEARTKFKEPELLDWYSDANEILPYLEDTLKSIIENY